MHCFDNGFVISCVIIGLVFINCDHDEYVRDRSGSDKDKDITPEDLYTFIALIDLVFTDGMKKICTGTIIHDCVVITAAHCFQRHDEKVVQAELTASFVVIGTKKMFDTGYEQYLPIERVIIHPNYSSWTADLALVYTFAGMMSDKPGLVVPIESQKTITPVDLDVTVFSWGQFQIINDVAHTVPPITEKSSFEERYEASDGQTDKTVKEKVTSHTPLQSNTEEDTDGQTDKTVKEKVTSHTPLQSNTEEDTDGQTDRTVKEKVTSHTPLQSNTEEDTDGQTDRTVKEKVTSHTPLQSNTEEDTDGQTDRTVKEKVTSHTPLQSNTEEDTDGQTDRTVKEKVTSHTPLQFITKEDTEQYMNTFPEIEQTTTSQNQYYRQIQRRKKRKNRRGIRKRKQNIKKKGKYRYRHSSTEIRPKSRYRPLRYRTKASLDSETELLSWEKKEGNLNKIYTKIPRALSYRTSRRWFKATSYYRNNWRRQIGYQQSKLAVEIFGFVNMQMCKKLMEKAMPSYQIKNPNEVICYASENYFVTEADSGAPAMRRGRLVAITVGGVNFEGERVAVGLKMKCFCSWISDNIPSVSNKWHCCKNCCDTEQKHGHYRQAYHRKHIKEDKK